MAKNLRLWSAVVGALFILLVAILGFSWLEAEPDEPLAPSAAPAAMASVPPQALDPSRVTVRVLADGRPVPDVGVLLQHVARAELFFTERSDANGEAYFSAVPRGAYRMTTMHLQFAPRSRVVSITSREHMLSIQLRLTEETAAAASAATAAAQRGPERSISGRVVDGAGRPIANAQVGASGNSSPRFTTTDAAGRFELVGLAGGKMNLFATAPHYAPAHQQEITVGSADVELVMSLAAELSGTLEFQAVPPKLYVKLCRFEPLYAKEVCVKSQYYQPPRNSYQIERAPTGSFSLVFSDGERELKRVPIEIRPGEQVRVPTQQL